MRITRKIAAAGIVPLAALGIALAGCGNSGSNTSPATSTQTPAQSDISFGCAISDTTDGVLVIYNATNESTQAIQIGSFTTRYSSGATVTKYPVGIGQQQGAEVPASPIVIQPGQAQTGHWFPIISGALDSTSCTVTQWTGQFVSGS